MESREACGGRPGERGYLMVEVVAVAFLAVMAAAVVLPFRLLAADVEESRAAMAADYLAQAEIAYLVADGASVGSYGWRGAAAWLEQNGVRYEVSAAVTVADYGTRRAAVTVSWTDGGGRKKTRTLARNFSP